MAKKKKKKLSAFKKFCIIGGSLIAIQGITLFAMKKKGNPKDFKTTVNEAISSMESQDKSKMLYAQVQLALGDFRIKNGGYPETLSELVPEYFDSAPTDPETGKEYVYSQKGEFYELIFDGSIPNDSQKAKREQTPSGDIDVIALLNQSSLLKDYVYDPRGKRDPFSPYDFTPKYSGNSGSTPLEKVSYNELKITAILEGIGEPRAIIVDPNGKGHTVKVDTMVGDQGGKIVKIESDRILILESVVDFTGEKQTRTVEMFLR